MAVLASRKFFHGALVIFSARVCAYGLSFVRNVILARHLTKSEFGLAVMFGATVAFLEVAGRMSFGSQILQAKDGGRSGFIGTSHTFQFGLSIMTAILLVAVGGLISRTLEVPTYDWAFSLLGIIPLCRSLENLDSFRQQRHGNFKSAACYELVPQVIITVAAWPLATWLGDIRVILWLMILRAALCLVVTHTMARRPYRWKWIPEKGIRLWKFGWPLLITGFIILLSQQGDQMLIGGVFSLDQLAPYALAVSVVSIPWFIFSQTATSVMLPFLARVQTNVVEFRVHYQKCIEFVGVCALVCSLPLLVGGGQIITLFYGQKYNGTGGIVVVLSITLVTRFIRLCPALASMAKGDTKNELITNVVRILSLPAAFIVASNGGGVIEVALCGLVAESLSVVFSLWKLEGRHNVPAARAASVIVFAISWTIIASFMYKILAGEHNLNLTIWVIILQSVLILLSARLLFQETALMIISLILGKLGRCKPV